MSANKIKALNISVGILISLIILITSINQYSFNSDYYDKEYIKNDIVAVTGIEIEELKKVTEKMAGYLGGIYDELNLVVMINGDSHVMFNEKEIAHMMDVKNIFSYLKATRSISIILVLLFVVVIRKNDKSRLYFSKALMYNGIFTIILFVGLLSMVYSDFTKYFVRFHEIFFTNDLWLLNPKTDRLIQMLPENFFSDIAVNIAKLYAGVSFTLAIIGANFAQKYKA